MRDDSAVAELRFEAIERRMKISKEHRILCIDLVCVHRHDVTELKENAAVWHIVGLASSG